MKTRNFLLSLSFLFIIYIVPAKAIGNEEHAYQPFVENGKQWLVVCATSQIYWMKRYYITEDTTVNNRTCKKLYCQTIDYTEGTDITELYSIIYEENGKVYYYPKETNPETKPIMLYDFSASSGDVVLLGGQSGNPNDEVYYQICKTISLENNNVTFQGQLAVLYNGEAVNIDDPSAPLFQWYESFGSIFNPFEKIMHNDYMSGPVYWLYECTIKGKVVYSNTRGLIFSDISSVTHDKSRDTYYTIDGVKLAAPPSHGVYLKNKTKIAVIP